MGLYYPMSLKRVTLITNDGLKRISPLMLIPQTSLSSHHEIYRVPGTLPLDFQFPFTIQEKITTIQHQCPSNLTPYSNIMGESGHTSEFNHYRSLGITLIPKCLRRII
tara:strand:+ start:376 stop:699 length:324 start_codon:yes stop_codon:yes gene_type:complete